VRFSFGTPANFEIRLFEAQDRFDIIYGSVSELGIQATVGAQRGTGTQYTQYSCNTSSLQQGLRLTFRVYACGESTFTPTITQTPTVTRTPTLTRTPTRTATITPTATATCEVGTEYAIFSSTGAAIVPGTSDTGNHCDDCVTAITLPFTYDFYGQPFTSVSASSNGNLQFSSNSIEYFNACPLPHPNLDNAILAHWDDLVTNCSGCGIYTSVSGSAPNRIFNIEWRAGYLASAGTANFEARLYEGRNRFDLVYGQVDQAGTSATIGAQRDTGSVYVQFSCYGPSLSAGLQLTFRPYNCGEATTTPSPTFTHTATATNTPGNSPTSTRTPTFTPTPTLTPCIIVTPLGEGFESGTLGQFNANFGWTTVSSASHTGTYAAFGGSLNDLRLTTDNPVYVPADAYRAILTFWHKYGFYESCSFPNPCERDGGVLEVSTDGGTVWSDAGANITAGGYNGTIQGSSGLDGRSGWCYSVGSFYRTSVNLLAYAGQDVLFRFRATTGGGPSAGWWVDDVDVTFLFTTCNPAATPTSTTTRTPTRTITPIPACGSGGDYVVVPSSSATIVPGTALVPGSQCPSGCLPTISLPFTYSLYGQPYNTAYVSSLGYIELGSNINYQAETCLPFNQMSYVIYSHWDRLSTGVVGGGVYTSVTGTAPNRIFNIEWRAAYADYPYGSLNFEARLYEGQDRFDIIYGQVDQGGSDATVGVQRGTNLSATQYSCNTAGSLWPGLQLTFRPYACGEPTFTPTGTPTITLTPTSTPRCGAGSDYVFTESTGASIVPGTVMVPGSQCSLCTFTITLPFTYKLYGQPFGSAILGSRGTLGFVTNRNFDSSCFPDTGNSYVIYPFQDTSGMLGAGEGIFTSTTGTAPNRIFNIEWRACSFYLNGSCSVSANFEVRLYEGQDRFDLVYGLTNSYDGGVTVGVQKEIGFQYTRYVCGSGYPRSGTLLVFREPPCSEPTITQTRTRTPTPTGTPATPSSTPTATPTPICGTVTNYAIDASTGATVVPGTVDIGNHCESCVTVVNLPFTYYLYGQAFTGANVATEGYLQFISSYSYGFNQCLPYGIFNGAILAYWDDLRTSQSGMGIYTSISGSAPNRIFNIEWRTCIYDDLFGCLGNANFEVRLYEGQSRFDIVYGNLDNAGTGATVGVQLTSSTLHTQFSCNQAALAEGLQLTFSQPTCATSTPTNTPTGTPTPTPAGVIVGHVTWQGISQPNSRNNGITATLSLCVGGASQSYSASTDASGYFTVTTGLSDGSYNWRFKGYLNLANSGVLAITGGAAAVEMGTLRAGDCNNSDNVTVLDFNVVKNAFGRAAGDVGYDDRADFNRDQLVNSQDFNFQKGNFGQFGAVLTCP
jgi:hypothetical protein